MANKNLNKAKIGKKDEFYTQLVDSRRLREISGHDLYRFISGSCVGLQSGYTHEGMEVVKL